MGNRLPPIGEWPCEVGLIWEGERTAHLREQSIGRNSTSSHSTIHPTPTAVPPKPDHPTGSGDGTEGPGPPGGPQGMGCGGQSRCDLGML